MFRVRDNCIGAIERTLRTRFSEQYSLTPWLEFFTQPLKVHAGGLVSRLTDWHRTMQGIHEIVDREGWAQCPSEGYTFAIQAGQITRADYIEITGVSQAKASRDLAEMVKAGDLVSEGKTRSRMYLPAPDRVNSTDSVPEEQLPLLPGS